MINYDLYHPIESKVISNKNRFALKKKDLTELKKDFFNSSILVTGGAGSIGSQFCKDILKFNFKALFIIDKDENQLTELNRELILLCDKKKLNKIRYICADLLVFNIDDFIKNHLITHYLNFAAIKHVRTEEELDSIKYMFLTNTNNFLPKKSYKLKKLFSISTDKTVNPRSLLGISKHLMESNLRKFKNENKIFVSSVRFANVSFSNGSILKYIVDRIIYKKPFGVPKNIKRFFITHKEASTLCFKAILKNSDGQVVLPNYKVLEKDYLISDVAAKIVRYFSYKEKFVNNLSTKKVVKNKYYRVQLTSSNIHGQKLFEEFYSGFEKLKLDKRDKSIFRVNLPNQPNVRRITKKILEFRNYVKLQKYLCTQFKNFKPSKNVIKVSKII